MILVDWQIADVISNGEVSIFPYLSERINPNSYDVCLGSSQSSTHVWKRLQVYHSPDGFRPIIHTRMEETLDGYALRMPLTNHPHTYGRDSSV